MIRLKQFQTVNYLQVHETAVNIQTTMDYVDTNMDDLSKVMASL